MGCSVQRTSPLKRALALHVLSFAPLFCALMVHETAVDACV